MKKIKKFLKKLNNHGSSLVMVVVCLAFIGIIVGSLLTAALYALRLKNRDLNSKDNFYILEQAMDEIYTGVGTKTATFMQDAYFDTLENMVEYDLTEGKYVTKSSAEADYMFKQKFLNNTLKFLNGQDASAINIKNYLAGFISDKNVTLDDSKIYVDPQYELAVSGTYNLASVTIHNIVLTRTVEYKNTAKGTFTQTIATDIVISEPSYDFSFEATDSNLDNIYNFAVVADMGIEIAQTPANKLSIMGNVYAASDFYNKAFYEKEDGTRVPINANTGNGSDDNSRYSGLYLKNSNVNIMADTVIVPGTVAVLGESTLALQGSSGSADGAEVWTDNIVLDEAEGGSGKPQARFYANLFVKDDTELNAESSDFGFMFSEGSTNQGSYYGYSYSAAADDRVFASTVSNETMNTIYKNDKHYNSSSIAINGDKSTLSIENADVLYLAGRTYIQLSKYKDNAGDALSDIQTGESISVKSNQIAYIPNATSTSSDDVLDAIYTKAGTEINYKKIKIVGNDNLNSVFFPKFAMNGYAPVQVQTYKDAAGNDKTTYYYDLDVAWDLLSAAYINASEADKADYEAKIKSVYGDTATFTSVFGDTGKKYPKEFISLYAKEKGLSKRTESTISVSGSSQYASGALTTGNTSGTGTYSISTSSVASAGALLGVSDSAADNTVIGKLKFLTKAEVSTMTALSDNLAKEYNYMKWNLGHYKDETEEAAVGVLGSVISPINNFINIGEIDNMVNKDNASVNETTIIGVNNTEYNVIVSKNDVNVNFNSGIVITLGDVHFPDTFSGSFEGLIVAGGKVYIGESGAAVVKNLKANPEVCKAVIRNLQLINSSDAENYAKATNVLKVLNCYIGSSGAGSGGTASSTDSTVTIDMISYSDVIEYSNWMRNVE